MDTLGGCSPLLALLAEPNELLCASVWAHDAVSHPVSCSLFPLRANRALRAQARRDARPKVTVILTTPPQRVSPPAPIAPPGALVLSDRMLPAIGQRPGAPGPLEPYDTVHDGRCSARPTWSAPTSAPA